MKVKELIEALSILNPEIDVVIGDADEGPDTQLNIETITDEGHYVELRGDYHNHYEHPPTGCDR